MFSYRRGYTTYYNRNLQASDSSDSGGDEDALAGTTAATDKENEKLSAMLDGPDDLVVRVELSHASTQTSTEDHAKEGGREVLVSLVKPDTSVESQLAALGDNPDMGTTFDVLGRKGGTDEGPLKAAPSTAAGAGAGAGAAAAADSKEADGDDDNAGGKAADGDDVGDAAAAATATATAASGGAGGGAGAGAATTATDDVDMADATPAAATAATAAASGAAGAGAGAAASSSSAEVARPLGPAAVGIAMVERCKWIPLRLTYDERKTLRLCEAALNVSEYTDKVDIVSWKSKAHRIHKQLKDICAILCGLVVANDYSKGQRLIKNKQFKDNEALFKCVFEVGRRFKIMNPDRMRTDYGKLLYLLQDASNPQIEELLEFSPITPIRTVFRTLEAAGCLDVLRDPHIETATHEVHAEAGKTRYMIQKEIDRKTWAVKHISSKFACAAISKEDIQLCLYSISDNNSYLRSNRDPVDKMITMLTTWFKPDSVEDGFSLAINSGRGGARLTHSHTRQYHYVLQSLTLWREINHDMFRLWLLAETDMLDAKRPYRLTDTGQGLNRVQPAPRIANAMGSIIRKVQAQVGTWIGSSVVHLGDHNVPSAFMFIDKYVQVGRILRPIVHCVEKIDGLLSNPGLKEYLDKSFGGALPLKKRILADFFRHGFDGSGADNFFDAGSCIDGRLTSAWNWCSKLEKKSFWPVFQLTDFIGFDGEFKG